MAYDPSLIADIHTHVLAGVDHGAQNVGESIAMLKESYRSGIRRICATPHYYIGTSPENFIKKRNAAAELLAEECKGIDVPETVLGAEVAYFKNISGMFDLSPLCLENTDFILIEPPYSPWDSSFFDEMEQLILRMGLVPVIAHVERFATLAPKNYERILSDMGAVLQYNAEHFTHHAKRAIKRIPENAKVVFGSDMHNMTDRAPNLAPALKACEDYMPEKFFESAENITKKIFGDKA